MAAKEIRGLRSKLQACSQIPEGFLTFEQSVLVKRYLFDRLAGPKGSIDVDDLQSICNELKISGDELDSVEAWGLFAAINRPLEASAGLKDFFQVILSFHRTVIFASSVDDKCRQLNNCVMHKNGFEQVPSRCR